MSISKYNILFPLYFGKFVEYATSFMSALKECDPRYVDGDGIILDIEESMRMMEDGHGDELVPLSVSFEYEGFSPGAVEEALRFSHSAFEFQIFQNYELVEWCARAGTEAEIRALGTLTALVCGGAPKEQIDKCVEEHFPLNDENYAEEYAAVITLAQRTAETMGFDAFLEQSEHTGTVWHFVGKKPAQEEEESGGPSPS